VPNNLGLEFFPKIVKSLPRANRTKSGLNTTKKTINKTTIIPARIILFAVILLRIKSLKCHIVTRKAVIIPRELVENSIVIKRKIEKKCSFLINESANTGKR
jgi:uncharacterized membrane protein YvbJ